MLEFFAGLIFQSLGELMLWLLGEIIASLLSTRRVFYAASLLLIGGYVLYFGIDKPDVWFRGVLLLAVAILVDLVIAPWLRRALGRAKLDQTT